MARVYGISRKRYQWRKFFAAELIRKLVLRNSSDWDKASTSKSVPEVSCSLADPSLDSSEVFARASSSYIHQLYFE
jgi:hypothetical protein